MHQHQIYMHDLFLLHCFNMWCSVHIYIHGSVDTVYNIMCIFLRATLDDCSVIRVTHKASPAICPSLYPPHMIMGVKEFQSLVNKCTIQVVYTYFALVFFSNCLYLSFRGMHRIFQRGVCTVNCWGFVCGTIFINCLELSCSSKEVNKNAVGKMAVCRAR